MFALLAEEEAAAAVWHRAHGTRFLVLPAQKSSIHCSAAGFTRLTTDSMLEDKQLWACLNRNCPTSGLDGASEIIQPISD